MSMDNRYELKFILTPVQHMEFMYWLQSMTRLVESYQERRVNSLYFDDPGFSGIRENLAGLPDRTKYRIRWYGSETAGDPAPRLEIKTRSGRMGGKAVYPFRAGQQGFFNTAMADFIPEIGELLRNNPEDKRLLSQQLLPVLYIGYQRKYFEDKNGIRATIDQDVRYQSVQLATRLNEISGQGSPAIIAELKFGADNRDKMSRMMRHLHLVPKRHSKYLSGMAMAGITDYV